MEEQQDWIEQEQKEIPKTTEFETRPALKLEENKVFEFDIDFGKPFQKWVDPETTKKKAIIPVTHEGILKNWWLNVLNPVYREILAIGKAGQKRVKIMQTGTQAKTKYILVK